MSTPIKPGTARRLGLRRPGQWSDTMERSTRPGWGSTDVPAAWSEVGGTSWTAGARVTRPMIEPVRRRDGGVLTAAEVRQQP